MQIERGYVRIGRRHVHYRRAGSGPAIVLLHASPVSSAMFLEQIEVFAERFTAIAVDTPGYGLSDKLAIEKPAIADYADALMETLDALGLERVLLYGRHTGASIAVEAARRHPGRVVRVLCDGYPIFPPEIRQRYIDEYLVRLTPGWDGSHLAFWWLRYRDQHVFWPWDIQTTATRADTDVPDLDFLNRGFNQIMMAGDGYRIGYAAAFMHDALDALAELTIPAWLTVRPGDSLFNTYAALPAGHDKRLLPRDTIEAAHVERDMFDTVRAEAPTPPRPTLPSYSALQDGDRFFLPIPGGSLHAKLCGSMNGRKAVVLVAPQPGGLASLTAELADIAAHWPVIGIEAPGQSDSQTPDPESVETAAEWILTALAGLGCTPQLLAGVRGSCPIAVEIGRQSPVPVALLDPPLLPAAKRSAFLAEYPVDIEPRHDGGHVLATWTLLRDERLWSPWFDRRRASALPRVSGLGAEELHCRAVDLLKQPEHVHSLMQQVWRYPLLERVASLPRGWVIVGETDIFTALSETPPAQFRVMQVAPGSSAATVVAAIAASTAASNPP
jgi:pimeloyl-ACP methyl ester carboxylesterase